MANPRQGRASSAGFSPSLGASDPRLRSNQSAQVTDADIDGSTIARDSAGKSRIAALDGMKPVKPTATLSEVIACVNMMMAKLKGRA